MHFSKIPGVSRIISQPLNILFIESSKDWIGVLLTKHLYRPLSQHALRQCIGGVHFSGRGKEAERTGGRVEVDEYRTMSSGV